ncbi:hypothetical protein YPPY06_4872, partial [Yersinia pestis PY-06]
MSTVIGWAK